MSNLKSIYELDVAELTNLAENPGTPDDVLIEMVSLKKEHINMCIAKRSPLSGRVFSELIKEDGNKNKYVLLTLIDNKSIEIPRLQSIIDHLISTDSKKDIIERCFSCIYERHDAPRELLIEGARSNVQSLQMSVLQNASASADVEIISILANSEKEDVVNAIARLKETPISILRALSKSETLFIRESVASNVNSDHEILERLSNDVLSVSSRVAKNTSAPAELLRSMFEWEHQLLKQYIAANLNCPLDLMDGIASLQESDPSHHSAKLALANNISTPVDILDKLLLAKNDKIIEAVVQNQSYVANENTIKCLTRVPDFSISARMKLADNPSTPLSIMLRLLAIEDTPLVKNVFIGAITKAPDSKFEALHKEGWDLARLIGHEDKLQSLESLLRDCKLFDAIDKLLGLELKRKIETASEGQSAVSSNKINRCV